jgi:Zn-dependent peptidase ImmA (M78 family)
VTRADELFIRPRAHVRRVEAHAQKLLDRCRAALDLDDLPLPVPVEQWIENPLGYDFEIADLSEYGEGVLGAAFIRDRRIAISDRIANDGRFRFTCAHELGHMIMHRRLATLFRDGPRPDRRVPPRVEWQADRFAAAFLMPVDELMRALFTICEDRRLDPRSAVAEMMRDTEEAEALWRRHFLPEVTARFGVSRAAAVFRFRDVRLSDARPFIAERIAASLLGLAKLRRVSPLAFS